MQINNLTRESLLHVELRDQDSFRQTFVNLCKENQQPVAAQLAVELLLQQKKELLCVNPERGKYEFILKNLKEIFPDIKTHFSKDPQKKNDPKEGLNIHAISAKGQKAIIKKYENANKLNGKKVLVADNFFVFETKVKEFFIKAKEGEEILLLVRHRKNPAEFPNDLTRHTSPVHLIKKNGMFQFFITDSQGGHSKLRPTLHAIKDVIKPINEAYVKSHSNVPMEINYDGGDARLGDGNNCIILAIKEGLEMIRNTDEVYEWIQKNRISNNDGTFAVPYLPLNMVQTAQSMTYITKYLDNTGQHEARLSKGKTLSEAIKKHEFFGVDPKNPQQKKVFNGKVAHIYLKFERQIIAQCILNSK
jgi:hypothetical protein